MLWKAFVFPTCLTPKFPGQCNCFLKLSTMGVLLPSYASPLLLLLSPHPSPWCSLNLIQPSTTHCTILEIFYKSLLSCSVESIMFCRLISITYTTLILLDINIIANKASALFCANDTSVFFYLFFFLSTLCIVNVCHLFYHQPFFWKWHAIHSMYSWMGINRMVLTPLLQQRARRMLK